MVTGGVMRQILLHGSGPGEFGLEAGRALIDHGRCAVLVLR